MDQRPEVKEYFEQYRDGSSAAELWEGGIYDPSFTAVAKDMENFVAQNYQNPRILDLGCGAGDMISFMRRTGNGDTTIVGMDISSIMSGYTHRNEEAEGITGDAKHIPFREESFSGLWSTKTIHFLDREDQKDVLDECYRVLESSGIGTVGFKTEEPDESREEYPLVEYVTPLERAKEMVRDTGFEICEVDRRDTHRHLIKFQRP